MKEKREKKPYTYLEETHSCTGSSSHKDLVTRASWVSWKSKEARVAGKREENSSRRWEGEIRGSNDVNDPQDLDSYSE